MAVLFSAVTVTIGNDKAEFLVAGAPKNIQDLRGWIAFEDLLERIDADQKLGVTVDSYVYGEGKIVEASPEEVAYLTERYDYYECFLCEQCENIDYKEFDLQSPPKESYTSEISL